ncbi:hypothetical protein F4779DRAFT_612489 [Xylariaceae sp. FL0662B]|nr:hypothetical protein F4779DRAFT_612489 [Xylariaceae sp. FL0662B]
MSYRMLLNPHQRKYQVAGMFEQIEPQRTEIVIPDSQETNSTSSSLRASPTPQVMGDALDQAQALFRTSYKDPLSKAIEQIKYNSQLPFDDDDSMSSSAEERLPKPSTSNIERTQKANQSNFQCMDPYRNRRSQNPNATTIEILQE